MEQPGPQVPRGAKMCQVTRLTAEVLGEACLEAPAQQGLDVFVDFQEALGLVRELLLHLLEMVPGLEPQEPKELDGIVKDKKMEKKTRNNNQCIHWSWFFSCSLCLLSAKCKA